MKEGTRIVVALGAAVIGGVAIAASGSAAALNAADAIAPIGTLWVNAIRMTVIPLIVSLLVTGIASTADVASIGRLGGRTLLVFVLLLACVAAVVVPLAPSLFALLPFPSGGGAHPALPAGAAEAASQLAGAQGQTFARWLTSLIPPNPIAAAANGDMVPLIVFSILLALAILRIPPATREPLAAFFKSLCAAMLVLVRWVVALAPIGVFALVLPLAAHLGASVAGAIGLVHRGVFGRLRGGDALVVSRGRDCRADLASTFRASGASGSVDRVQLELVDRVAAGVGRERRAGSRHSESNRRILAAARRVALQDRRAGVVDRRRACSSDGSTESRCTRSSWRLLPSRPCFSRSPRLEFRAARSSCSRRSFWRSDCPSKESASSSRWTRSPTRSRRCLT